MTREMGKPIREANAEVARGCRAVAVLRRRGLASRGRDLHPRSDGKPSPGPAPSARRRRSDLPLELPVLDPTVEGRAGAHLRKLRGAEGSDRGAASCTAPGGVPGRGRTSIWGFQRRHRAWRRCRNVPDRPSRGSRRSPSPARFRSAIRCATWRSRSASASSSSSEATARSIVMADADLNRAIEAAFAGAFWSAGQKCTATRRIYVQAADLRRVQARLHGADQEGEVGDPTEPATEVGPLVTERS